MFYLIEETFNHSENKLDVSLLCDLTDVSRSGYYNWLKVTKVNQEIREKQDEDDFNLILKAYSFRGYAKGSRSINMRLLHMGVLMNRKKVQRLMKKYNLICPIRKRNPHRKIAQATKEHATKPNLVQRQFKAFGPRMILLTDITYCFYGRNQVAYLSTIKDAYTNEILAYTVSESLKLDFVLDCINQLCNNHGISLKAETIIHSDQGVHYTSMKFQELVKDKKFRQSMSRKANCWDNAPQESFFGHMKDEVDLASCDSFLEVTKEIDDYMDYYNNDRYQMGLAKLSPVGFYKFVTTGVYPLAHLIATPEIPNVRTRDVNESILDETIENYA